MNPILSHILWAYFHTICLVDLEPYRIYEVLKTFGPVISCLACAVEYDQYISAYPPPQDGTSDDLFAWTVTFHNTVNERLNKPIMPVDDALLYWRDYIRLRSEKDI